MSNATSVRANESATISVRASGVTAMPLPNSMPSATCRTAPSGVTSAITPDTNSAVPAKNPSRSRSLPLT